MPPVCECGHIQGDHRSGGQSFPHPVTFGVCLSEGCDCREYRPAEPDEPKAAA